MPPLKPPPEGTRSGSAGLEQLATPLLVVVFLSMSLSSWFFGTAISRYAAEFAHGVIEIISRDGYSGASDLFMATLALAGVAAMTALPALLSIHIGAIMERRYSPYVLPRLRRFGGIRIVCAWATLFFVTPRIFEAAHEDGWRVVISSNEHGVRAVLGWESLTAIGLATLALVAAAALAYLSVEIARRMRTPLESGPAYSTPCRSPIPRDAGHPFHGKPVGV